jgi:hypothetical protein
MIQQGGNWFRASSCITEPAKFLAGEGVIPGKGSVHISSLSSLFNPNLVFHLVCLVCNVSSVKVNFVIEMI